MTAQRLDLFRFAVEILVTLDAERPYQISKGKPEIAHKLLDNPMPDQASSHSTAPAVVVSRHSD